MVAYTLGWLHERKGDAAAADAWYRRGRELPPDYCFPFRIEEVAVLERASAADPKDPRAPYYLGNLLYDLQPDRAIVEWERSRALDPGFARVHRNLAFAYARAKGELARAAASQEKAVSLEKREPRLYYELDQYLAWTRAPLAARLARLTESPDTVASREITAGRLARVQVLMGRDDEALQTLGRTRFHVWEGEGGIHSVYVAARLERGPPPRSRRSGGGGARGAPRDSGRSRQHRGGPGRRRRYLAAVHHHVGLALERLGPEGRGGGGASASRRACPPSCPRATTGSADRSRSSAARRRPDATSSAWPPRSPGPWTRRARSRCAWRPARVAPRTST